MGLLADLSGPILGVVISALLFVVVALVGMVDLLGTLASPDATLVGLVALGWGLYRLATGVADSDSRWVRNERMATIVRMLERQNEWARQLNLAETVTPTDRERAERDLQRLIDDYAAGRISDEEFERQLERQLADGGLDDTQASRDTNTSLERDRS